MLIALWSAKGGVGVTVTTLLTALRLHRADDEPVLIVDLDGDVPAAAGVDVPTVGVADWTRLGAHARPDALDRLIQPLGPGIDLLPRGSGPIHTGQMALLAQLLRSRHRSVIADLGRLAPDDRRAGLLDVADRSVLVTRCCYLALRAAVTADRHTDALIVVTEPGRALRSDDLQRALGVDTAVEIPIDPSLARLVDAGLLLRRCRPNSARLDDILPTLTGQAA